MKKTKKKELQWALIGKNDVPFGEIIEYHVMPIVVCDGFRTKKEAQAFHDALPEDGAHCVTDDEGFVTGTYFGHDLDVLCSCHPTVQGESLPPCYTHRHFA